MESIFSLDHFSAIAPDLHYVLLLGQPLPEFPCTAWHISSQPAPSVPLILSQRVLLISPASRTYFGHLRSIVKIEKSSLVVSMSPEPSAYWDNPRKKPKVTTTTLRRKDRTQVLWAKTQRELEWRASGCCIEQYIYYRPQGYSMYLRAGLWHHCGAKAML